MRERRPMFRRPGSNGPPESPQSAKLAEQGSTDGGAWRLRPLPYKTSGDGMGIGDFFTKLFGGADKCHDIAELARRLRLSEDALRSFEPAYKSFTIPKKLGGGRLISAPDDATKKLQRTILRKLFRRLKTHPAATGFKEGRIGHPLFAIMGVQDPFIKVPLRKVE
jgi:hypothetical protein